FCGVAACSSVLVAFFGYASPRDPASFPTRRSSDLGDEVSVDLGITVDGDVAREAEEVPRDHHVAEAHRLGRPEHAAAQASLNLEDRKSTRLNSSHVKISYAVFCLKKKMRTHQGIVF